MNGGNSTKHSMQKLREYYDNKAKKNDNKGISKSDLFTLFKEAGYLVTEQIKLDILNSLNVRNAIIDFDEFIRLWGLFHNAEDMEGDDAVNYDYIDAFVAMGGNPDTTGFVKRTKVIDVIKEFELTIDMDEFMEKIGEDEELEFDAFCQLFDKPFDDSKSMQSILSVCNQYVTICNIYRLCLRNRGGAPQVLASDTKTLRGLWQSTQIILCFKQKE